MRINRDESLTAALDVEKEVKRALVGVPAKKREVYSTAYENGRERGLKFSFYPADGGLDATYVYVAQCRSGDSILICTSKSFEWHGVTEEEYQASTYVDYKGEKVAAVKVLTMGGFSLTELADAINNRKGRNAKA
jgi:hypothetical protein